jgi:hypothetical protein
MASAAALANFMPALGMRLRCAPDAPGSDHQNLKLATRGHPSAAEAAAEEGDRW